MAHDMHTRRRRRRRRLDTFSTNAHQLIEHTPSKNSFCAAICSIYMIHLMKWLMELPNLNCHQKDKSPSSAYEYSSESQFFFRTELTTDFDKLKIIHKQCITRLLKVALCGKNFVKCLNSWSRGKKTDV